MAIVKHKTSKNARYTDVLDYFTHKHKENQMTGHYEPILDEYGLMVERDDYAVVYITAKGEEKEPELWASACVNTNNKFGKNKEVGDRKNHEYIIAHPAEDNMTVEQLVEEGRAFVKEYLAGYDCLLGAHDNHVHIAFNSVRALPRKCEQEWMMRDKTGEVLPCEMEAGGKHQHSPRLRIHMNDWLLEYTRQHGYVQKDNNAIADVHRAERHGAKNEHMKAALLEAASRSRNMVDLQRLMKQDYNMDLKVSASGKTISILYPGNQKYIRLRSLGLGPADISGFFIGNEYVFTKEIEEEQIQKEIEAKEKKKYIQWLKIIREKNDDKAEQAVERADEILAQRLRQRGEKYAKEEFRDLRYLILQLSYVSGNLQTELEKVDRLLDRWEKYQDPSLSAQERRQHGGYVRWCGCDPDSAEELSDLKAEREIIVVQQEHAAVMYEALTAEVERWRGLNNLTRAENNLAWQKQREKQLKQQLKNIKASRKKLWEIAYNCERSARKYGKTENYKKAAHFHGLWVKKVLKQKEIKQQLKETKKKKKEAKIQLRQVKKANKNIPDWVR